MEITEVRIKLMEDTDDRLQGFCSITFDDCFVVRDLKIIEGSNGPFVAMPSRKLTAHCPQCGCKNHLRAGFCNHCGNRMKEDLAVKDHDGRAKLYADIAHPINSNCREMIQEKVIAEYRLEQERAKLPGYVSRYDDFYEFDSEKPAPTPTNNTRTHLAHSPSETRGPHRPPARRSAMPSREEAPSPPKNHKANAGEHHPDVPSEGSKGRDFGAGIF